MTRPVGVRGAPRVHLTDPDAWPHGEVASDLPAAHYAQRVAAALAEAVAGSSLRAVGRNAGVSHRTLAHVMRGESWPDLITLSALELALGWPLWPGPHLLAADLRACRRRWDALGLVGVRRYAGKVV